MLLFCLLASFASGEGSPPTHHSTTLTGVRFAMPSGAGSGLCLTPGTACNLFLAQALAQDGDTILLLPSGSSYPTGYVSKGVAFRGNGTIPQDVVFQGQMLQIGQDSSRLGSDSSIQNVHFKDVGTAMEVWLSGASVKFSLIDVIFGPFTVRPLNIRSWGTILAKGTVWTNGNNRAIYSYNTDIDLTLINCTMSHLGIATDGGGIYMHGAAQSLSIYNSSFVDVSGQGGGVVYKSAGTLVIQDSIFTDCVGGWGAAIQHWNGASTLISGSIFTGNQGIKGTVYFLDSENVQVNSCTFVSNSVSEVGGGIWQSGGNVSVANTDFCLNTAAQANPNTYPSTLVADCIGCTVDEDDCCPITGEVIYRPDPSTAECRVASVYASESGAGDCFSVGTPCSLATAYATVMADGTIHLTSGTYTTGLTLLKSVTLKGMGDVVFDGATIQVGTNINLLTAASIENIHFKNAVDMQVYLAFSVTHVLSLKSVIFENCGDNNAAVVVWTTSTVNVDQCQWVNSTKRGMYFPGGINQQNMVMTNSLFKNIHLAISYGAAIYTQGSLSTVTLVNSSFVDVSASLSGALYLQVDTVQISGCLFSGCSGGSGSAVYSSGGSSYIISTSTFANNQATSNGGALYFSASSSVQVQSCVFTSNHAALVGGAIYQTSSTVTITTSTFCLNTANNGNPNTDPVGDVSGCGSCSVDADECCSGPLETVDRTGSNAVDCVCGGFTAVDGSCGLSCPTDEYDFGDGICHGCSDFSDTHTCTECSKTNGCSASGCLSNYLSPDMPKDCLDACKAGQYESTTPGQCGWCDDFNSGSSCLYCNKDDGCTTCPSGSLSMDDKALCLAQCPTGQFDSGNGQCQNCSINCEDVCEPEGGDCTCKDPFCGDQCMEEFDECDKCGGAGSPCDDDPDKSTDKDESALDALGKEGQVAAIAGGGGLLLIIGAAAVIAVVIVKRRNASSRASSSSALWTQA